MWLRIDVPRGAGAAPSINFTFEIFDKTATRLPEGLFMRFNVSGGGATLPSWRVRSLDGGAIDPFDVVPGGNHHLHGFAGADGGGIAATQAGGATLYISSDSAGLASFGNPSPLPAPVFANSTKPSEGSGFCLLDNTWGTNYPAWLPWDPENDSNQRWRFVFTSM